MIVKYTDKLSCYFEFSHRDGTFIENCRVMKRKKEEV